MVPTLFLVSVVCFFVIQIAPGSFTDRYLEDPRMSPAQVARIQQQLGLDRPTHEQYLRWVAGIVTRGDFGFSFFANRPVWSVIGERLWWTVLVAGITMAFAWLVAVPPGIVTAPRRNGVTDFLASFLGYIGLAQPAFLVALLAIGTGSIAAVMRQMRANLLDVLNADYVRTARAKGLPHRRVINKHAVRTALNPLVSLAGLSLPELINGTIIASIVLNLPTIGPLLYDSLINKDQYVAMSLLLLSSVLLMVGNLLADVALAWIDPRIRYD